jgi:uncharacterized membrane protein (UPF0127 family)
MAGRAAKKASGETCQEAGWNVAVEVARQAVRRASGVAVRKEA